MPFETIKNLLNAENLMESVTVQGWVRTRRDSKGFSFLEINDGSCLKNLQVIADETVVSADMLKGIYTGAAVTVAGPLVESPGKGQKWELKAASVALVGTADPETYPLQKKRPSDEFLRTIAHLRPRTNKYGALFRIRSECAFAFHDFFHRNGFVYIHTPIITGSDCEGAGEMFRVTTLDPANPEKVEGDLYDTDFFGKQANLTVSGQLEAEALACALGKVYTFGPTFRAENSNTPRHAAEFWMIEPEAAFFSLNDNMNLAEDMVKSVLGHLMKTCPDDLELFAKFVDTSLMATLEISLNSKYERAPYTEAIKILESSGREFEYPVQWGIDLQTEHERFLCEEHFKKPVIIYDYPKTIKPFYMRLNDDDRTVGAMDLLVPRVGELVGGSAREERMDVLDRRIKECGLDEAPYWWYMDLRRFGTCPHAGFGLGFERFLMMVTGVSNIRDVIPFPRTPRNLEF